MTTTPPTEGRRCVGGAGQGEPVCTRCGSSSAAAATFRPISRMEMDQRITLESYGRDDDQQFAKDGDILLCTCGNSHWSPTP